MAYIREGADDLQARVEDELLERWVLLQRHDQILQEPGAQAHWAPLTYTQNRQVTDWFPSQFLYAKHFQEFSYGSFSSNF
jgi:hypothetical protein